MSRRRPAVLAVDGGNSKTDLALVSRGGDLLALVTGPTTSHQQIPMDEAMDRLAALAAEAAGQAGSSLPAILASFCVAGADYPGDVSALRHAIEASGVGDAVRVRNDGYGALRAGAPRGWGVVVICGAGVNALGIGPDGRTARLAGVGDFSGDWGGAYGIGKEALAVAVRARDGRGAPTTLAELVPQRLGLRRPADVTRALYDGRMSDRRLEELAPLVFEAAVAGDALARGIVDRLADELAVMATAIARRLRVVRQPLDVVLTGGVFRTTDRRFFARLEERITSAMPHATMTRLQERPVLGAALIGLDELGVSRGAAAERRLRREFRALA